MSDLTQQLRERKSEFLHPIDPVIRSIESTAKILRILSADDFSTYFYEVSFKAIFISCFQKEIDHLSLSEEYEIDSEVSPDTIGGSYVDLMIKHLPSDFHFILEFKYIPLKSIIKFDDDDNDIENENFRKIYDPKNRSNVMGGQERRSELDKILKEWNTDWLKMNPKNELTSRDNTSPLNKYGEIGPNGKGKSFYSLYFGGALKKDDQQIVGYWNKASHPKTGKSKDLNMTIPILIRGILNRVFYFDYGLTPLDLEPDEDDKIIKGYYYVI